MYTLSDVCNELLIEIGESQPNKFARMYQIGLSGLREINTDVNGIIKIIELTINSNDTVDLPDDFMQYSKIGVYGSDGRIHSLGLDNSLSLNKVYSNCGVPIKHNEFPTLDEFTMFNNGFYPFFGVVGNPLINGGLFGLGGGQNGYGYFRFDRQSNQLLLSNLHIDNYKIVMEYVADVNSSEGDFQVHPFIIQTIKDWILWKWIVNDRNFSSAEKQNRSHIYYNSRRLSNNRYGSHTIQEWSEALRKSNTATTRF